MRDMFTEISLTRIIKFTKRLRQLNHFTGKLYLNASLTIYALVYYNLSVIHN